MQARWRHPVAFVLVAAYATILVGGVALQCLSATYRGEADFSTTLSRDIFETLTNTQLFAWLVLGPALTAGSISGERENGLLEGVVLTQMHPRSIAWGKWLSAMSLVVLLLLVPLPAIAICFLLGGVSPVEFFAAFVLHAGAAASGAAIGLAVSAWSRRSGGAIGAALRAAAVWQIVFLILQPFASIVDILVSPLWAFSKIVGGGTDLTPVSLLSYLALHALVTIERVRYAGRGVGAVLEPEKRAVFATPSTAPARQVGPSGEIVGVKQRRDAPAWLRFENPVMQRTARARVKLASGYKVGSTEAGPSLLMLAYCFYVMPLSALAWFSSESRNVVWWLIVYPWLFAVVITAAIPAASLLSGEREAGHWQALWLTPLTAREIIGGKLWGVLFGCGYWSLFLLPGLLPCLFGGVSPETAVTTVLVVFAEAWLWANIGLFWSAVVPKSATATNWTVISLVLAQCFAPVYIAWHFSPLAALGAASALLVAGELLLLATHRILRDAPKEK